MPPRKLTPVQVLERLLTRLEKRMEALQRVKLDGFQKVAASAALMSMFPVDPHIDSLAA